MILSFFHKFKFALFFICVFMANLSEADDSINFVTENERTRFINTIISLEHQAKELNEANKSWQEEFLLRNKNGSVANRKEV